MGTLVRGSSRVLGRDPAGIHARDVPVRTTEDVPDSHTSVLVDRWWIAAGVGRHGGAWSIGGGSHGGQV